MGDADTMSVSSRLRMAFEMYGAGKLPMAEGLCSEILRSDPHNFHVLHLAGVIALRMGQSERGILLLKAAISAESGSAPAHNNLGNGYRALGRPHDAQQCYRGALAIDQGFAEAWSNLGIVLTELRRPGEALASCNQAIALKPDWAEPYSNRARALIDLGRPEEALQSCDRALAISPGLVLVWGNRALALTRLHRHDEATGAYARLLEINRDYPFVKGMFLFQKLQACDWAGVPELISEIETDLACGKRSAEPFAWQAVATSPLSLKLCAEIYCGHRFPPVSSNFEHRRPAPQRPIRIGYVSGEFREHATSLLFTGVLEHHDRGRFEIIAFDNGWDDGSPLRKRIENAVPGIIDISRCSDRDAAAKIHQENIGILVNLNGHFGGSRMGLFAHRPAPIQVGYLGFPGTLGAPYFDYLLADRNVIPREDRPFYIEKIAWLPDSYQCNDDEKQIEPVDPCRRDWGLPERSFVFCCFNNNYKISPGTFSVWMRVLQQVEGSVLWLLQDNETAAANLRREAELRGVDPGRLVFARRVPQGLHLARHRCADLFLDTLPYNAHTTASDALWAGVPVLTCRGDTFPGRVGESLLRAVDLPELVTKTPDEYQSRAVELATYPHLLAEFKHRLQRNRKTAPLFDTGRFTRNLEGAFRAIWNRHCQGLRPDHIEHIAGPECLCG